VQSAIGDATRHGRERAHRIDGIEVAQQKHRLDPFAARKINLQIVGELFGAMNACASAKGLEAPGEQGAHTIAGQFVVAGGFNLDELADGFDEGLLPIFEVLQPFVPNGFGVVLRGEGFFLRHRFDCCSKPRARGSTPRRESYSIIFKPFETNHE
jgi:hypothetical protein